MMGMAYGGLFVLFLAGELGLFDGSSAAADTDTPPEDDTPGEDTTTGGNLLDEIPADDLYDAADFSGEVTGTEGDDSLTGDDDAALAWFLGDGDDSLDASDLNDHAEGGAGNDDLMMRPGDDIALGGDGDDYRRRNRRRSGLWRGRERQPDRQHEQRQPVWRRR